MGSASASALATLSNTDLKCVKNPIQATSKSSKTDTEGIKTNGSQTTAMTNTRSSPDLGPVPPSNPSQPASSLGDEHQPPSLIVDKLPAPPAEKNNGSPDVSEGGNELESENGNPETGSWSVEREEKVLKELNGDDNDDDEDNDVHGAILITKRRTICGPGSTRQGGIANSTRLSPPF